MPSRKASLCKVCAIEDFRDYPLLSIMQRLHGLDRDGDELAQLPHRKHWEMAKAVRAFADLGRTGGFPRVLGVGAGLERTGFLLTTYCEQVFMTDLYADKANWRHGEQYPLMLTDPAACIPAGTPCDSQRLVVQHMDARELHYPDNFFDGVFSSSSIEHFGALDDVAQAVREMARVLKPGGVLTLATEFALNDAPGNGWLNVIVFNRQTLNEYVIAPSGCTLADEPVYETSPATLATAQELVRGLKLEASGQLKQPYLVLRHQGYTFTSIFLALIKPGVSDAA